MSLSLKYRALWEEGRERESHRLIHIYTTLYTSLHTNTLATQGYNNYKQQDVNIDKMTRSQVTKVEKLWNLSRIFQLLVSVMSHYIT